MEGFTSSKTKLTQIYLDENVGIRQDSYLGITNEHIKPATPPLQFYQTNRVLKSETVHSNKLVEYRFLQNIIYTKYTRTKYNLLNVLAELGGIFNSCYLIGHAFTISFSYNLMMSSLIRKLYLFNAKFESEKKKPKIPKNEKKKEGDKGGGDDGRKSIMR